jgi:hypothetical protein
VIRYEITGGHSHLTTLFVDGSVVDRPGSATGNSAIGMDGGRLSRPLERAIE